jgi:hypothetical protein
MEDLKKIVWLASYPKSGNTWFRAFLTALLNPGLTEIDINNMHPSTIASSRQLFDELTGISSSDLTSDEIDRLRPMVYRQNAKESDEIIYQKVHDAFTVLPDGKSLFPEDITKAVVYFIRNPLDIAVSFAHHLNISIDKTISLMDNPNYAFCPYNDRLHNQLRQKLRTWSGHVKSWVDNSGLPLIVIRYEDMKVKPIETFAKVITFMGLDKNMHEIEKALELSSFDRLKKQEEKNGFLEKNTSSPSFFRKGLSGDWENFLSPDQVKRIKEHHGSMMNRFEY